ncbi:GIY-YIG nuclease family protein [Aeromonas hydrophila]|uniref:GIY-YIG nuclease family protein n=1 Tax=Aeromonas hydrophila TaxID=644 RepID=UPI001455736E|nr:GIY-YIG nuclease family protein [Aeromonas hydrophila]NLR35230.1 GIY-YIG nuclease family protein [Aeromonas hydrophila]
MKSEMRLIKNAIEYASIKDVSDISKGSRGIYVLYKRRGFKNDRSHHYDVVYVGMARQSIKSRLDSHQKTKSGLWSHFSAFEVWDNITDIEIAELEGLFRQVYRFDSNANKLNVQKSYEPLNIVAKREWL